MLDYIEQAKQEIEYVRKNFIPADGDFLSVTEYIWRKYIFNGIEKDLALHNPNALFDSYADYFTAMQIPTITIRKGRTFYRGRIGNISLRGAIDDHDTIFKIPYYDGQITAAPPLYVQGGRFNREGVSYLYLATTPKTCLAETHVEVGQSCSIGKFRCKNKIELLDLSTSPENPELKIWYEVLTQPIHSEIKYKYRITQFISDVLAKVNNNGIYFKSTQSDGFNIVCFNPDLFALIKYSERLYLTTAVKYQYRADPTDDIVKYTSRNDCQLISSCNIFDEDMADTEIEHMVEWIEHRKSEQ